MSEGLQPLGNGIFADFIKRLSPEHQSVYYGALDKFPKKQEVAVKKMTYNLETKEQTEGEIQIMMKLDKNVNTVRYLRHFMSKTCDLYIAMELCRKSSLQDVVRGNAFAPGVDYLSCDNQRKIVLHITLGLTHIHQKGIKHRTLKPTNILLSKNGKSIKITGFGLSKLVEKSSTNPATDVIEEWGSPEHYAKTKMSAKSDVFSAGLVFHYVLSDGKHAFAFGYGAVKEKIKQGKCTIDMSKQSYKLLAKDLIERTLEHDSQKRLSSAAILCHPFLWNEERKKRCADFILKLWEEFSPAQKREVQKNSMYAAINKADPVPKRDAVLLLYCNLQSGGHRIPKIYSHFEKTARKMSSQLQYELGEFNKPMDYEDLDSEEFEQPEEYEALNRDVSNLSIVKETSVSDDAVDENIVSAGNFRIQLPSLRPDSWVFAAKRDNVVVEEISIIKVLDLPESSNQGLIKAFKQLEVFRWFDRLEWPNEGNQLGLPTPGVKYICILMEDCLKIDATKLAHREDFSQENRKLAVLQMLSALSHVHENKLIHGNISPRKFCLSKDGTNVRLLGSRRMMPSSQDENRQNDLWSAAKVFCILVCCGKGTHIENVWDGLGQIDDLYKLCDRSSVEDGSIFRDFLAEMWTAQVKTKDLLQHPFFWKPERRMVFLCDVADEYNKSDLNTKTDFDTKHANLKTDDWIGDLKLREDEKVEWFRDDENGLIHKKASAPNSKNYKNCSVGTLVRLIRNASHHIMDDIEDYKSKKRPKEEQSLLKCQADVWKFFHRRFPELFLGLYKSVKDDRMSNPQRFDKYFKGSIEVTRLPRKQRKDLQF